MESEDTCLKCDYIIPRKGKKIFFGLVLINVIIIWFIYKKSSYLSYFNTNSIHVASISVNLPLYNVPIFHIPLLYAKDMAPHYAEVNSNTWCLKEGTNLIDSKRHKKCICRSQWFGLDCGIPSSVWKSQFMQEGRNAEVKILRRDKPRRIILSIIFEDTFDLLDISIQNLFPIVDVFLVAEERNQNESSFNKFKKGYLAKFQNKIMPIQLYRNIVYTNEYDRIASMLKELWNTGWNKLSDFRPDDIFVFSHVSSIIAKDILLFLKLYDGYPEPFYFTLKPVLFKFSKVLKSSNSNVTLVPFEPLGCTLQFISAMCDYSVSKFLEKKCMEVTSRKVLFEKQHWMLKEWVIGDANAPSGWQCNFCCSTNCILEIIRKQRWLQNISASLSLNHQHLNVSVIENCIKNKNYFHNNVSFETISKSDAYFCPKIMFDSDKYDYLLG